MVYPGHSAKSAGGRLQLNTHTPYVCIEPCFGIGHNLSLICQMTSEDIKHQLIVVVYWPSGFRGRKDLLNRASALVTTCP